MRTAIAILLALLSPLAAAQSTWTKCADEGGACSTTAPKAFRYGQPFTPAGVGTWTATRILSGNVPATNAFWGDPSPGTGKQLQRMDAPATASPQLAPGGARFVVEWTPAATNVDGSPIKPILSTKIQASATQDFAAWLQWENTGSATSYLITDGPVATPLYWRAAHVTADGQSAWLTPRVRTEAKFLSDTAPPCAPFPVDDAASATPLYTDLRLRGGAAYWACKLPDGSWRDAGVMGVYKPDCIRTAFVAALNADKGQAKAALLAAWIQCVDATPLPGDSEFVAAWTALRDKHRPKPAPTSVVREVTPGTSRPAYRIANGARSSTVVGRVAEGRACDCAAFQSGDYCAVTGQPNVATGATGPLPASAALCGVP